MRLHGIMQHFLRPQAAPRQGPGLGRAALAAALALLLAAPGVARAECSGDDGDSDSGAASGDDDDDDQPACEEVSGVVGHSVCRRFGSWDASRRPPLRVTVGTSMRQVALGSTAFSGAAPHDMPASYRVVTDPADDLARGATLDVEVAVALGRHLYAGLAGSGGVLAAPPTSKTTVGELDVSSGPLTYLSGSAVLGAALELGDYRLLGELGAGVQAIGIAVDTSQGECEASDTRFDADLLLEPRLVAARWLTPWISAGAGVSTNLLGRRAMSLGLFVGGHLRAFDAGR